MDLANPKTRNALGGLLTGHFTKANIEAAVGTGLDLVSAIPGGALFKAATKGAEFTADAAKVADKIPTLVDKLPQLASDGEDVAKGFASFGEEGASKAAQIISSNAHGVAIPVKLGISAVTKVANIGRDAENAFKISAEAAQNLNLGWKVKGVATNLYHDFQEAY